MWSMRLNCPITCSDIVDDDGVEVSGRLLLKGELGVAMVAARAGRPASSCCNL